MSPDAIHSLRERLGLSQREFGIGLGLSDGNAARAVRGWEAGTRNGQPDAPAGPTIAAMLFLTAILDVLEMDLPHDVRKRLFEALPDAIRRLYREGV